MKRYLFMRLIDILGVFLVLNGVATPSFAKGYKYNTVDRGINLSPDRDPDFDRFVRKKSICWPHSYTYCQKNMSTPGKLEPVGVFIGSRNRDQRASRFGNGFYRGRKSL